MNNCPNCSLFKGKCFSRCCGPVPINKKVWSENIHLIQRPFDGVIDLGDAVMPKTEDLTCVFLSPELKCMIYNDRPPVCHEYGSETHILMTCAYQKPDGSARSRSERRRIEKEQEKQVKKSLG